MMTKARSLRWCAAAAAVAVIVSGVAVAADPSAPLRVLILTGLNNHDWAKTTPVLEQCLETCPRFGVVDLTDAPGKLDAAAFAKYDVIVSNWTPYPDTARQWPPETEKAFLDFIRNGGGFVALHAAACTFQVWPEFQRINGLTWQEGHTSHTAYCPFPVVIEDKEHPIARGLSDFFTVDELYQNMVPVADPPPHVVWKAFSAKDKGGTDKFEPVLVTTLFEKGRGVNLVLGHDAAAMKDAGFQTLLLRGAEWAATGNVTIPAPANWPTTAAAAESSRVDLDEALKAIANYAFGQSRAPLSTVEQIVMAANATGADAAGIAARNTLAGKLAAMLGSNATADAKQFVCRQLSLIGTAEQVPALAALLKDENLSSMARYALERIPGPEATKALRDALAPSTGLTKIGIVNSLGERHDAEAVGMLVPLLSDPEPKLAGAAAGALGKIGGDAAAKALSEMLGKTTGVTHWEVADAYLKCADRFLSEAKIDVGLAIYKQLYVPTEPAQTRVAALRGLVLAAPGQGIPMLLEVLAGNDMALQNMAVRLVRDLPGEALSVSAAAQLPKLAPATQEQLLSALADRGNTSVMPAVVAAANGPDEAIRIAALKALAALGDLSCVNLFAERFSGRSNAERDAASNSLSLLKGKEVNAKLLQLLPAVNPETRVQLVRALAARNAVETAPELLKLAEDNDAALRTEAWKSLEALGREQDLPPMVDLLTRARPEERDAAEKALVAVVHKLPEGKDPVGLVLAKLAAPPNLDARCSLLRVLGGIGDDKGLPKLQEALKDADAQVRDTVIRTLGGWPAATPVRDLLQCAQTEQDDVRRALALQGFVKLCGKIKDQPPEQVTALIADALKVAARPEDKKALLGELGNRPCPAALQLVMPLMQDAATASEAILAALQIGTAIVDANKDVVKTAMEQVAAKTQDAETKKKALALLRKASRPANLALGAKASNPDGLKSDGGAGGPETAIDGKLDTYWDETDNQPLYVLRLDFKEPIEINAISIVGHEYQSFSPKNFEIVCDDKPVKTVQNAEYDKDTNECLVTFPNTKCQSLALRITASYGNSPGIRELEVYNMPAAPANH